MSKLSITIMALTPIGPVINLLPISDQTKILLLIIWVIPVITLTCISIRRLMHILTESDRATHNKIHGYDDALN